MNASNISDLLARHADGLMNPSSTSLKTPATCMTETDSVLPLLSLAELLHTHMKPVYPRPAFVHKLRSELVENDRRRMAVARRMRRILTIGAAVLGSVVSIASVVGAIILFHSKRQARGRTAHAPST